MVIRDLSQQGPTNRGGGYLTDPRHEATAGGRHLLSFRGPEGATRQVLLTDPTYTRNKSFIDLHRLEGAGPAPTADTLNLLGLLQGAVTVPDGDSLDFAVALDWYNKIVDGRLGPHTDLADLVHRGKYWYQAASDAGKLKEVGWAVVDELAGFIGQHPVLRAVDAIASPPGHDAKVLSFGSRVAAGVSIRRGVPLIRCGSNQPFRTPAKSLEPSARAGALGGHFDCSEDVYGQCVLIVDDVYGTGATAEETARALRTAGAAQVMSLAAVRTMKFL